MIISALVIYSRLGSRRLPQKALKSLGSYSLLEFIILRLKPLEEALDTKIIIATTDKKEDESIVKIAKKHDVSYFRGDENNVVKRTFDLINYFDIEYFCRVNGDCPFVDQELIIAGYEELIKGKEFVSNIIERTYPYGVAVEWVNSKMYIEFVDDIESQEKEHVTKHLYRNLDRIEFKSMISKTDLSMHSLTVDTYEDLSKINTMLDNYSTTEQKLINYKQLTK